MFYMYVDNSVVVSLYVISLHCQERTSLSKAGKGKEQLTTPRGISGYMCCQHFAVFCDCICPNIGARECLVYRLLRLRTEQASQ